MVREFVDRVFNGAANRCCFILSKMTSSKKRSGRDRRSIKS